MICVDKTKESLKTLFICQYSQICCGILQLSRLCCCAFKQFFVSWVTLRRDAKLLLNGYAVTQNYVFVVFQSEATKNKSHDLLIKHIKETIVMKIFMQFWTNFNYMASNSDCLIEICNTHTFTFGYQTHFFSQFTFELHLAWNVFDCLLWVWGPRFMMVNIATIVAPVNNAFF